MDENAEENARKFLEMIFGAQEEDSDPAVIRNQGCTFTEKVVDYLFLEWEIELIDYPHEIQDRAIDMVDMMKARGASVPGTAAKIAMEVIPI